MTFSAPAPVPPLAKRPTRRSWMAAAAAALTAMAGTALLTPTAHAQNASDAAWPHKTVRIVVPFVPGGAADILARSLGEALQRDLGQAFVVDNRPGAGGNIGAEAASKSPADGYTWLLGLDTTFSVNPFVYQSMPFKSSDFKPLMVVASQGSIVVVNSKSPIHTLKDLIEQGKTRPLSFSSAGYGTPGHLGASILTHATGVQINHIPYKGNAPASTAVLSSEVDGGVLSASVLIPHVNANRVRALAITTAQRNPLIPNVPTVGELGHKDLGMEVLFGIWVPAQTPEAVLKKMEAALLKAGKDSQVQERLRTNDLSFEGLTGAAASQRMQAQIERNRTVIQATGMKME